MSLMSVSVLDIVKKQYVYKLKSYTQEFMSLIIIQVIAILFSLGGTGMMGTGISSFEIQIHYYSADIVAIFTMFWGFSTSIRITAKSYRFDDFAFVTNRSVSGLSNLLFLLTASFIGGMTSMLSTYILKDIMYLRGVSLASTAHVISAPAEFLLGFFITSLYIFLFSSAGYLIGTLVQLNKVFIVLLPALFIGGLFFDSAMGSNTLITFIYHFLFTESSLIVFIAKIFILSALFFAGALSLSNRMEVNP